MKTSNPLFLATLEEGSGLDSLESLFSGAPLPLFAKSLVVFMNSPDEVTTAKRPPKFRLQSVFDNSAIRWNPITGITELDIFLNLDGVDRQDLLKIGRGFDPSFKPYACLTIDPMRSVHIRRYLKSVMSALPSYPVSVLVSMEDPDSQAAQFWADRFNPEAQTNSP